MVQDVLNVAEARGWVMVEGALAAGEFVPSTAATVKQRWQLLVGEAKNAG
jgi:hypothetical protein